NEYNLDAEQNMITAKITFDFGKLLTFGRYGSSGAGNCQRSTGSEELSQSLMSMMLDSNQFMVMFSKPNAQPLGFMQIHLLETEERGAIFLLEDPYTNEPDKITGMKEAAALLSRKIEESTGINCYTYGEGEETVVKVPKSYVKRYIDFAGGSAGKEAFTKRLKVKEL
ncbi:MAG TPA: hypothetical protein VNF06_01890, partial [Candidatus Aquilonibacter sp.]|nr:hypothetical protein [Candidatus Aquilonibacter sp.]